MTRRIKIPTELLNSNQENNFELVSKIKDLGIIPPDNESKRCIFCNGVYRVTKARCSEPPGHFCEYDEDRILNS